MVDQKLRERVIKGLECCIGFGDNYCDICPYSLNEFECDREKLKADALTLLKAQEPRVLTLSEVRTLQDGALVWAEDNDKVDVIPVIVNHVWNSLPNIVSFTATAAPIREVKADMLWYKTKWRCWTSRPTDEQREATPWN